MSKLTRDILVDEVFARMDERFVVEDPHPYGGEVVVTRDQEERTLIMQPGGPHFAITVQEVDFQPAR